MILAPYKYTKEVIETEKKILEGEMVEKEVIKEKEFINFRPVYVFDISQTEGEPVPDWKIEVEDSNRKILNPLVSYAKGEDIRVEFKRLREGLKGYSEGGKIVLGERLNNTEKAVTLCHEIAHEKLHNDSRDNDKLTKEIVEMEAEAVSFLVSDYFNIDNPSGKYLALYKKSYDLMESFKRINRTSTEIIDFIKG
ncbi:MAG TPA: ImmA/IrrE family metallo-endopeptidase [Halanaerobiales bacterium]|nr:ImmA/IrrE family metallo-endopeptidase [Halanaerobiales bacterium]